MLKKLTYRKFVYAAYGFFLLLSLAWFVVALYESHTLNYTALFTFAIFCVQAYYNHRMTNLVVGIILLPASIFGTLYFLSWGGKVGFDAFIGTMTALGVVSIAASLILAFSYLKMSFDSHNPHL
ncbi:hypothetical protein GCM10023093_18760 [Nemorincola caseinilytica]|uniref:Uncharacterized protein n=1 Tax=Nemorincola caseinilytica TaxID=2054315 RepID=A0ABP8NE65_9BACT